MNKVKARRKYQILQALSDLSKNGWANARPCDYEPLEKELCEINRRPHREKLKPLERNIWVRG